MSNNILELLKILDVFDNKDDEIAKAESNARNDVITISRLDFIKIASMVSAFVFREDKSKAVLLLKYVPLLMDALFDKELRELILKEEK